MHPLPFLQLPLELRLQVYEYIAEAVPRTAPMADYAEISYRASKSSKR
jgi:hypothetical protein